MNERALKNQVELYKSRILNNFDSSIIDRKMWKISKYLKKYNINDVVLGISGGIDSTVVLALLSSIKTKYLHDLKIHAMCINFDLYKKYANFDTSYIEEIEQKFTNVNFYFVQGDETLFQLLKASIEQVDDIELQAQVSYALRYTMFFAKCQEVGGVSFGTTNRDEFEYSGWFGKTSDMVVDIQPITDWHKFQVVEAAKILNVPDRIIERVPKGDLIDGTTDEENFGCSYDELSWFTAHKERVSVLCHGNNDFWIQKFGKLINLREKNAHKYQGQKFNPIFLK